MIEYEEKAEEWESHQSVAPQSGPYEDSEMGGESVWVKIEIKLAIHYPDTLFTQASIRIVADRPQILLV